MATLENLWYLSGFPEGTLISGPICKLQDAGFSTLAVECMWWLSTWSTPRGGSQVTRREELYTCCGMYVTAESQVSRCEELHTCCGMYVMAESQVSRCEELHTCCGMHVMAESQVSRCEELHTCCGMYVMAESQVSRCEELHTCCGMYVMAEHLSTPRGGSQVTRREELHPYCGMYVTAEHSEHTKGWVTNFKMRGVAPLLWNVCDGWALGAHQGVGRKLQDARSCTLAVEYIWRLSTQSTPRGWSQKCQVNCSDRSDSNTLPNFAAHKIPISGWSASKTKSTAILLKQEKKKKKKHERIKGMLIFNLSI